MVWTFYYSPFPPVPVRLVYCNVCSLVHWMQLSSHLRAMFLKKSQNKLKKFKVWVLYLILQKQGVVSILKLSV